jgi:oxepin-CoA hydrolase/3-oxo-5,6-dehydrosuberyl-CoA semialdehyde dehydrogenase
MGPVASKAQLEDVRAGIGRLAEIGRVACGGVDKVGDRGYFVAPTLVVAADPRASIIHGAEVFGPVATVVPYSGAAADAAALANQGGGCLVGTLYSNDDAWMEEAVLAMSPWHGRLWLGSDKTAGQAFPPGGVMPQMVHGGPGRAGGGEELGGLRGLEFYMQRTALQGYQGMIARAFGARGSAERSGDE